MWEHINEPRKITALMKDALSFEIDTNFLSFSFKLWERL